MSATSDGAREVALGLVRAVRLALPAEAPAVTRMAARDVAQVLGFEGLDRALAVLDRHAGARRPRDIGLLAARIERLLHEVERDGDLGALRAAESELSDYAGHLDAALWGHAAEEPADAPLEHVHEAAVVLADLPVDAAALGRARLTAHVASALRAALDWAGFDLAARLTAQVHDSALTLTAAAGHEAGLGPAAAVLATVEGSLSRESDGRWTMRVPLHAERGSFLLVRQGRLAIALPWHSVARLRMLGPGAEQSLAEPVLAPFTQTAPAEGERPAALVALGLARAWVVADRIVWRVSADPGELDEPGPFGSPVRVVTLEGDDRYWVADAAHLLRGVEPQAVAPPAPRPRPLAPVTPFAAEAPGPAAADDFAAAEAPADEPVPAEEFAVEEPSDGAALADAVARAIELLRAERGADVAPTAAAGAAALASEPAEPRRMPLPAPRYSARVTVIAPADVLPVPVVPSASAPATPEPEPAVAAAGTPYTAPRSAPAVVPAAAPQPAPRTAPRRALVADDSMVARLFLARMLERRGWAVETAPDGAALWELLQEGAWTLVCADFAMPDAHGRAHVERLLDHRASCREPYALVVLTRDDEEAVLARDAGAALVLRKPFEDGALDALLEDWS